MDSDPLIMGAIDPVLPTASGKRSDERESLPRRKRPAQSEKTVAAQNENEEENKLEPGVDTPQHKLDDLA